MIFKRLKKPDPEAEERRRQEMEDVKLSWKDRLALVISAYAVLVIPSVLVIVGICLLLLWVFGAL